MREAPELGLDARASVGLVPEQTEVGEVEAGTDRARHQREGAGRPRRLPVAGGHGEGSRVPIARAAERDLVRAQRRRVHTDQGERIALVECPELVRRHRVPAAQLTGRKQEVDGGESRTRPASVLRGHAPRRAEVLAEEAALRMRLEPEPLDQLLRARVHAERPSIPR